MSEWIWIDETVALAVHDRSLILHGGAAGTRDLGLLQSALARPQNVAAYNDRAGIAELAAAYTTGIMKNHPFVDGNKRTGFVVGVLFIELNGRRFTAREDEAAHAVLDLAASLIDEGGFAMFLGDHIE